MKRIVLSIGVVVALGLAGAAIWVSRRPEPGLRTVELGQPLPMDETVKLRFVDEETGEEDVWTVTKRVTSEAERPGPPELPVPDPDAADHRPDDSARALDAQALESWKHGDVKQALALFEAAIEADPDDAEPRSHYGRLLTMMVSYDVARPQLERAAELRPDDPQVWLDLATLYEKSLELDSSWAAQRRAKELAGGREIRRGEQGFWVLDGTSIYP